MRFLIVLFFWSSLNAFAQQSSLSPGIPQSFVENYYRAYSGVPKAERLAPFYHSEVIIDDPTYDWKGIGKESIFSNFDKNNEPNVYQWRIDQVIYDNDKVVTEGELLATYKGFPYAMRFVNIFHFKDGLIFRQYDYFDNADYFKAVEASKKVQPKN